MALPIFPFEIGVFLLGVIAYRLGKNIVVPRAPAMTAYVVAAAAAGLYLPDFFSSYRFVFLLLFAAVLPTIFELTKDWRFDRFLADISFPLYLCHWPLAMIAWRWPSYWPGMPATVMAIVYSCVLVIYVERPIDKWRHARFRDQRNAATRPQRIEGQKQNARSN